MRASKMSIAFLPLVLVGRLAAAPLAPAPAVHDIDWRSSPLDLDLRGFNGERFSFRCLAGKPAPGQVTGSGPYADGSSICTAAVHAGALRSAVGGIVTIQIGPGQDHFQGSIAHFVTSVSYAPYWSGSFTVITLP